MSFLNRFCVSRQIEFRQIGYAQHAVHGSTIVTLSKEL